MFGGRWGAFDSTQRHFFKPSHPIYQSIQQIAAIRQSEPALRYGRQYFREISGNGVHFGHPIDGRCTLAYSRILDDTEVLVALNLDAAPRSDYVTVDANLTPAGVRLTNLLDPKVKVDVEACAGRSAVKVPLAAHDMAILRRR
jgi:hypothetical protein